MYHGEYSNSHGTFLIDFILSAITRKCLILTVGIQTIEYVRAKVFSMLTNVIKLISNFRSYKNDFWIVVFAQIFKISYAIIT